VFGFDPGPAQKKVCISSCFKVEGLFCSTTLWVAQAQSVKHNAKEYKLRFMEGPLSG
jgi:hypothetical protein